MALLLEAAAKRHLFVIAGGVIVLVSLNISAAISPHAGGWYFLLYVAITLAGAILVGGGLVLRIKNPHADRGGSGSQNES